MKRLLKWIGGLLALTVLGLGGLALWLGQAMQKIPILEPATQIEARVYNESYGQAIEVSREALDGVRQRLSAPAVSWAVSVDGALVWAEAHGTTDLETGAPATLASRFAIGSVSKPLTAAAALKLAEEGRLDLDADVHTYAPAFPKKPWPITTRQLLSHQGGIRHYKTALNPPTFSEAGRNKPFGSVTESLSIFAGDPLLFEPDTGFNYSTYGYTLVSAAMEGTTGEDFLTHMERTLFAPLGMGATGPDVSGARDPQRVSDYVQLYPGAGILPAPAVDVSYKWAGGGLASTPTDLARFGSALLGGDIIGEAMLEEMLTAREVAPGQLNPQHYGLGLRIGGLYYPAGSDTIIPFINHGGTAIGGVSVLILMPQSGVVVAMCANVSGPEGSNGLRSEAVKIVRAFLDERG